MTHYTSPTVEQKSDQGVAVWRLLGDWSRDLPLELRHGVVANLLGEVQEALVLDLRDVRFIDSWGEEVLCDAIQRQTEEGKRVCWTLDATRTARFHGVIRALERRHVEALHYPNTIEAMAAVRGAR